MKKLFIVLLIICSGTIVFGQTVSREPEIKYDVDELLSVGVAISSLLQDKHYRIVAGSVDDVGISQDELSSLGWYGGGIRELKLAKMMANYDNKFDADGIVVAITLGLKAPYSALYSYIITVDIYEDNLNMYVGLRWLPWILSIYF